LDDTLEIWEYLDKILGCYIKKIKLRLEKDGLTITDYKIIYLLTKGQQPMKNIAGELSLANGWVTDIVDRLERKNLLLRKHDMNDRRIVNVELTKEGRNYYEELGLFIKNIISESLKNLNKDEIENFKLILNKISDAIGTELLKSN
jgi:DNA-binding MarR family transcriptional regulator